MIKAARCARRGPAPALGLSLGRPGRRAPAHPPARDWSAWSQVGSTSGC